MPSGRRPLSPLQLAAIIVALLTNSTTPAWGQPGQYTAVEPLSLEPFVPSTPSTRPPGKLPPGPIGYDDIARLMQSTLETNTCWS
jgi:hypothetical protein